MKDKSTVHSFSLLTVITVAEKLIAFLFEAIIAAKLGTNIITDGYFTSAEMFTLIDSAFLSAIVVVALNRYTVHVTEEGEERGFSALSELQSFYFPLMVLLTVIIFLCAKPLSYIVAPGYGEEARYIVIRCIRVMSVIPSIVCITSIGLAVLRQKKAFGITALKSLFISVVGIISVLIFSRNELKNADALSIAYVISILLYCALVRFSTMRYGHLRFTPPRLTEDVKTALKMMLPLMVSYGIGRVALMVDKSIASGLGVGAVSALTYAHSLYKVVGAIFVTNLTTIILTDFNNMCARNEYDKITASMRKTISIMTMVLLPIAVVTVFCSNDIVKIVYERGKFSPEATAMVGGVLLFYALNFVPVMIQGVYIQALYAFGDTVKPMLISMIAIFINLGTSIPLTKVIGLPGVAIGTVASTVIAVILERIAVKKYLPDYEGGYALSSAVRYIIALAVSAGAVFGVTLLKLSSLFCFAASTLACFAVFFGTLLILREKYLMSIIGSAKKKLLRH